MKIKIIVFAFILFTSGLDAQIISEIVLKNTTIAYKDQINYSLNQFNPDSFKFGQLVAETPSGAKLFRSVNMSASAFMTELKNSFRGKALLIDFWATWCAPCLEEMPYSKKLQEEVKDLPIIFIYLCTSSGSDYKFWKWKVTEMRMPGIHVFVPANMETDLIKLFFKREAYPYYVFINQEGKYIPKAFRLPSDTDRKKLEAMIQMK